MIDICVQGSHHYDVIDKYMMQKWTKEENQGYCYHCKRRNSGTDKWLKLQFSQQFSLLQGA